MVKALLRSAVSGPGSEYSVCPKPGDALGEEKVGAEEEQSREGLEANVIVVTVTCYQQNCTTEMAALNVIFRTLVQSSIIRVKYII